SCVNTGKPNSPDMQVIHTQVAQTMIMQLRITQTAEAFTATIQAPTATAIPLPVPTPSTCVYTVQSGDTLWGISSKLGISLQDIVNQNRISDPNAINEGNQLTVPKSSGPDCVPGTSSNSSPINSDGGLSIAPIKDAFISGWNYGEDEDPGEALKLHPG